MLGRKSCESEGPDAPEIVHNEPWMQRSTSGQNSLWKSSPVTAIQSAVLDGLGQVGYGELLDAFEIGDGASDFEDAVVRAGGETLLLHGSLEETFGVGAKLAMGSDLTGVHLRIGVDFFAGLLETPALMFTGGHYAGPDFCGAFGSCSTAHCATECK